jgi:hypothetical protein
MRPNTGRRWRSCHRGSRFEQAVSCLFSFCNQRSRTEIYLLVGLLFSTFGFPACASETLQVKISIPYALGQYGPVTGDNGPSLVYNDTIAKNVHFYVLITNVSHNTQRIWEDWNSCGRWTLAFELTDEKGRKQIATRPGAVWTINVPTWWELAPGETHVFEVYFADPEQWNNFPMLSVGESKNYTIRAVYKISESPESKQYEVWTGNIESAPVRMLFHRTT